MPDAVRDGASFRDPSGHVYDFEGRILRTVSEIGRANYEHIRDRGVLRQLCEQGYLIASSEVECGRLNGLDAEARYVIEHPRLPFVSYPYEWPFPVLQSAALFHLDFNLRLFEMGLTLSDASAYNVQFDGVKPIFIDLLSLRPYQDGEYWIAHRQFCEQFLNPLLLRSVLGVQYNNWYRGSVEGIPTTDLARLVPFWKKLNWKLFTHVVLQAKFQRRAIASDGVKPLAAVTKRPLPASAYRGMQRQIRKWIAKLRPADAGPSVWARYTQTHTYDHEEETAKQRFVAEFVDKTRPSMLWDLGCNTGDYSELAASNGAERVIGFDADQSSLDRAYRRASERNLPFLPLYLDAANPSPAQGWQQGERRGLAERANADALLALAFEHHLAIGRNVPIPEVVDWITGLAPRGIIEFVEKSDPTIEMLLALREDIFPDYDRAAFEAALSRRARVVKSEQVSESGRRLYWYDTGTRRT